MAPHAMLSQSFQFHLACVVQEFMGEKELYASDHEDVIRVESILQRCEIHPLSKYRVYSLPPLLCSLLELQALLCAMLEQYPLSSCTNGGSPLRREVFIFML